MYSSMLQTFSTDQHIIMQAYHTIRLLIGPTSMCKHHIIVVALEELTCLSGRKEELRMV